MNDMSSSVPLFSVFPLPTISYSPSPTTEGPLSPLSPNMPSSFSNFQGSPQSFDQVTTSDSEFVQKKVGNDRDAPLPSRGTTSGIDLTCYDKDSIQDICHDLERLNSSISDCVYTIIQNLERGHPKLRISPRTKIVKRVSYQDPSSSSDSDIPLIITTKRQNLFQLLNNKAFVDSIGDQYREKELLALAIHDKIIEHIDSRLGKGRRPTQAQLSEDSPSSLARMKIQILQDICDSVAKTETFRNAQAFRSIAYRYQIAEDSAYMQEEIERDFRALSNTIRIFMIAQKVFMIETPNLVWSNPNPGSRGMRSKNSSMKGILIRILEDAYTVKMKIRAGIATQRLEYIRPKDNDTFNADIMNSVDSFDVPRRYSSKRKPNQQRRIVAACRSLGLIGEDENGKWTVYLKADVAERREEKGRTEK